MPIESVMGLLLWKLKFQGHGYWLMPSFQRRGTIILFETRKFFLFLLKGRRKLNNTIMDIYLVLNYVLHALLIEGKRGKTDVQRT